MRDRLEKERRERLNNSLPNYKNENLKEKIKSLISYPLLLRYFRAHVKLLTGIQYIDAKKLIITSSELNVRIFTLTGRYIGFFGQYDSWKNIITNKKFEPLFFLIFTIHFVSFSLSIYSFIIKPSMPRDLRKVCSSNTFSVVYGSKSSKWKLLQKTVCGLLGKRKFIYL